MLISIVSARRAEKMDGLLIGSTRIAGKPNQDHDKTEAWR